ncbi:3-oxoacyl-[acyl-carrier-protein] reductase [Hydrogenispora ethanolica]|uniref:3-oxoacyl-[acyl-carrier-protein] reductase n=1 Tax=Hydrogenispora ethanolica TaxID=1082276 RepID=A0A4R1RXN4_HYDET|nr:3-oxoacyl-[acyl-carrier-protein] reductase [Hydrogenispora ethanolica]
MADLGLKGKVALVTGSARGLGRAIAEKLAAEQAKIVATDINEAMAETTAAAIGERFRVETLALGHDVAKEESTKAVVKAVVERFGRIDILVNNAGITRDARLMMMKMADWELVLRVNLTGAFLCSKLVSKQMLKQNSGSIVNIASVSGLTGNVGQANYSASKAGLIGLTKTTARELAERGINVNAIAPGFIVSDMTEVLAPEVAAKTLAQIPMNRYGQPDDVANVALFLVSDLARYITGQVIPVDGGMVM